MTSSESSTIPDITNEPALVVNSTRFGTIEVPKSTVIEFPTGLIGFPEFRHYVMLDHKPPFSWLHSINEPGLAFVVIDGSEFGLDYSLSVPFSVVECDFRQDEEFAVLIVVTVRSDPTLTTANLKAPLFVNIRNRRGVQVIYDDPKLSTRYPIWSESVDQKPE